MKQRPIRRMLACLLALLLLPVPTALAEEPGAVLTVTCRDIFRDGQEKTVSLLETEDGYYITFDEAIRMVGLIHAGGDYFAPNAHVSFRPDTSGLDAVTHGGETWYALDQMMTELKTTVLAADGELYYNSLPVNQDLLLEETERIMDREGYEAALLSVRPGLDLAATLFAFGYDVVRNQRFEMLTGKGYEDDISALLLEMLKHHGDNESLLTMLANRTKTAEKVANYVEKAQSVYEWFYTGLDEVVPGGGYLLFGLEGSGPLLETMETVNTLGESGLKLSDLISVNAYVHEIKSLNDVYANALERVLETPPLKYYDSTIVEQGERILRIYEAHMTDSRDQLAAEGVLLLAEDIIGKIGAGALKSEMLTVSPVAQVTKSLLDVADACTLKTMKKNDCVRNIAMCAQIQNLFRDVYRAADTETPDAQTALTARDAAMLYLKSAWVAYDSGSFDEDIAGMIGLAKANIDKELILLAGFTDGMFCVEPNEPLPVGILGFRSEQEATTGNEDQYHEAYLQFLREGAYIDSVDNAALRQALAEGWGWGAFYFHDVDRDGTDDLIVWSGCSGADGEVQLFSGHGTEILYRGSVPCDGSGIGLYGSTRMSGLILSEYDGSGEVLTGCDVAGWDLAVSRSQRAVSLDGWEPLEADGHLPLEAAGSEFGDAFEVTALDGLFLMTIPGSWGESFLVKDGERGFAVCEKRSYEAGFGGELFRVTMTEYTREEDIDVPNHQVLGRWAEGFLLVAEFPLSAQFDLNDARQRESWQAMEADVPGVLASLRMTG